MNAVLTRDWHEAGDFCEVYGKELRNDYAHH